MCAIPKPMRVEKHEEKENKLISLVAWAWYVVTSTATTTYMNAHVSLELPMYTYTGAIRDVSTYGRPARQAGYIREGPDEWEGSGGPCHGRPATTTKQGFVPGHLSRLSLGPG